MRLAGIFSALMLAALPLSAAQATTWDMDSAHSSIGFSVKHMMVSNTHGAFKKAEATLDLNEADLTKSTVNVEIKTVTIDTGDEKRDNHLRSADFFDVEKYPKMTFKSKSVTKNGDGYKVQGDLTIKDVTKPVTLDVTLSKTVKDPWGMERKGVEATTTINRQDFGITWNKSLDAGGVAVGDDVKIVIEAEFVKRKQ